MLQKDTKDSSGVSFQLAKSRAHFKGERPYNFSESGQAFA